MWEKVEWFGDLAKRSEQQLLEAVSVEDPVSPIQWRPYTAEVVKEFTDKHPDEDIISFISYTSVKTDMTKQWVPFGLYYLELLFIKSRNST
jgi:hypothetical protein